MPGMDVTAITFSQTAMKEETEIASIADIPIMKTGEAMIGILIRVLFPTFINE